MESLPLNRASNLTEALNRLDPKKPLSDAKQLEAYYVDRPESPRKRIEIVLRTMNEAEKILFTGHRGSGKSTELSKLAEDLRDEFLVVQFSIKERVVGFSDLQASDVSLSLGMALFDTALKLDVTLDDAVVRDLLSFTREITREVISEETATQEVESGVKGTLQFLVTRLINKLRTETTTRTKVLEHIQPREADLNENIDVLARELEVKTGKRILMIVMDLDKTDLNVSETLFYRAPNTLLNPQVNVIYTFPTPLRHDKNFGQVEMNFDKIEVLPNVNTVHRNGDPCPEGVQMLKAMLTRRVDQSLYGPDVLDKLTALSSGIPRELIALAQQACLEALLEEKTRIEMEDLERAAKRKERSFGTRLSKAQRRLLYQVHEEKDIDNEEEYRDLLHNLSVLEYRNADKWYDVHPLAQAFMTTSDGSNEDDPSEPASGDDDGS